MIGRSRRHNTDVEKEEEEDLTIFYTTKTYYNYTIIYCVRISVCSTREYL